MTTTEQDVTEDGSPFGADATENLWLHFSRMGSYRDAPPPVIVRGEGASHLRRPRQALPRRSRRPVRRPGRARPAGARPGRRRAGREAGLLPDLVLRAPGAIELSHRLAAAAPGDLNRVFFTTGGGEAVETAWKAAKQYFKLDRQADEDQGHQPGGRLPRHHAGSAVDHRRAGAQGGVRAAGARARSGCPTPTSTGRRSSATTPRRSAAGRPTRSSSRSSFEGPDTVAAVFLEPVQNAGGCFPPPPGYFDRVREICDQYDVLLVSDEVICAFGRLGHHVRLRRSSATCPT